MPLAVLLNPMSLGPPKIAAPRQDETGEKFILNRLDVQKQTVRCSLVTVGPGEESYLMY